MLQFRSMGCRRNAYTAEILTLLKICPQISEKEIADKLGVSIDRVGRLLERLERGGLVTAATEEGGIIMGITETLYSTGEFFETEHSKIIQSTYRVLVLNEKTRANSMPGSFRYSRSLLHCISIFGYLPLTCAAKASVASSI